MGSQADSAAEVVPPADTPIVAAAEAEAADREISAESAIPSDAAAAIDEADDLEAIAEAADAQAAATDAQAATTDAASATTEAASATTDAPEPPTTDAASATAEATDESAPSDQDGQAAAGTDEVSE